MVSPDLKTCAVDSIAVLLGLAFFLYGAMIWRVGSGTRFFLVWFLLGLLCFFWPAAYKLRLFWRLPRSVRAMMLVFIAFFLGVFFIVECCVICGTREHSKKGLGYIIILGAQVSEGGPSTVLRYRLDKAAAYLKDNPETLCIVTGGQGRNEPFPEAAGMRDYLMACGIGESRILLEEKAQNTAQNLEYSAKILMSRSEDGDMPEVGIVTNDFHMFRSLSIARKQGYGRACSIVAGSDPLYLPNNMLREFFGICKDIWAGNIGTAS